MTHAHRIDDILDAHQIKIVSHSLGHTKTEIRTVVSCWDRPHVLGPNHPRERQINLDDGTKLRQGDSWGVPVVTRWRGDSPQAPIIEIRPA